MSSSFLPNIRTRDAIEIASQIANNDYVPQEYLRRGENNSLKSISSIRSSSLKRIIRNGESGVFSQDKDFF